MIEYLSTSIANIVRYKVAGAVFLVWLFHVSGILGILYGDKEWFLESTPLNLLLSFVLMITVQKQLDSKVGLAALVAFTAGMVAEGLGVNYGLLFGSYWYGEHLGPKVVGVPLLIGVNWCMLTFITGAVSAKVLHNKWFAAITGALLMVGMDFIIEPTAPEFDFWYWENNQVPLQNYIGWFLVAVPIQLGYQYLVVHKEWVYASNLLAAQILFFGVFYGVYA